jgi:DNA-binding SARP family transcriptional activator
VTELSFGLLGELEIRDGDREVRINTGKLRVMLAVLLLRAGKAVSLEELTVRLWDDDPPNAARGTLQAYAMRLRRALGDNGREPRLILTRSPGYTIDAGEGSVDVVRFHLLLGAARAAGLRGDLPVEGARLDEALRLWRGPALSGIQSESLRRDVVPRLVEERLRAWERRIEIDVRLGRHAELIGELTSLTREYPLREGFWGLLMSALHRSGRQAEALNAFGAVRRLLRDELGIDPGERLHRLHQQILAGEPPAPEPEPAAVARTPSAAPAPVPAPAPSVAQLPPVTRGFVGRSEAVSALARWIDPAEAGTAVQVATISGGPGVGKTALALQLSHQVRSLFPDGQLFARLRGHSAPAPLPATAVLSRFLRDLGVPADRLPEHQDGLEAMYRSLLADRRVLVVVDEAASAAQVQPLLPGHPGSAVLVTSRHDLTGLAVAQGGHRLALAGLAPEESRGVLVGLIGRSRAAAEPEALAELAEMCGHLPLALRIAGAKLAASSSTRVDQYVGRLRHMGPLEALQIPGDPGAGLRAAFHASYVRLPERVQRFFVRLTHGLPSVFNLDAAVARLGGEAKPVQSALDHLVSAHLLSMQTANRYRFDTLVWEYGLSLAADAEPVGHPGPRGQCVRSPRGDRLIP